MFISPSTVAFGLYINRSYCGFSPHFYVDVEYQNNTGKSIIFREPTPVNVLNISGIRKNSEECDFPPPQNTAPSSSESVPYQVHNFLGFKL